MEYDKQFERDFMRRTLSLVEQYSGPHDATLLLNCLLGLLIVPKETSLHKIPDDPITALAKWGISPSSIIHVGDRKEPSPDTLRGIVWSLRNAVAHFRFEPRHEHGRVTGFEFSDKSGFRAVIEVGQMRDFVEKLAHYLDAQFAE